MDGAGSDHSWSPKEAITNRKRKTHQGEEETEMHRAAAAAEEAQPLRKRPSNPDFEQPVFRQHDPSTTERACMADPAGTRHRRARGKRDTVPITEGLTVSAKSLRPLVSDGSRSAGAPCGHRSRGKKKKKKNRHRQGESEAAKGSVDKLQETPTSRRRKAISGPRPRF